MSIYDFDKEGNMSDNYFSPGDNFQGYGFEWYNPVAMANEATWNMKEHRLRTKLQLKYNILDNLVFQSFVAFDADNQLENKFLPHMVTGVQWTSTYVNLASGMDYQSTVLENQSQLLYTWQKGTTHKLTSMLAFTLSAKKNGWYYGSYIQSAFYLPEELCTGRTGILDRRRIQPKPDACSSGFRAL